jgi:hypothetical protein
MSMPGIFYGYTGKNEHNLPVVFLLRTGIHFQQIGISARRHIFAGSRTAVCQSSAAPIIVGSGVDNRLISRQDINCSARAHLRRPPCRWILLQRFV